MHWHGGMVHRGREGNIAIGKPAALGEQHRAAFEIEALDADMLAFARGRGDGDSVALTRGVFLDDDRVSAGGQDTAGENARGLAGADRAVKRMSGCDFADDFELDRHSGNVRRTHRVTVHRGDVGRRLGAQRRDVGGEHPPVGVRERRGLGRERLRIREHAGERLCDRHQRH